MTRRRLRFDDFCDDDLVPDLTAASLIDNSHHTLRQWRTADPPKGPRFVRVGAHVKYRIADLKRFIARNTVATTGDPEPPSEGPNLTSILRKTG